MLPNYFIRTADHTSAYNAKVQTCASHEICTSPSKFIHKILLIIILDNLSLSISLYCMHRNLSSAVLENAVSVQYSIHMSTLQPTQYSL